MSDTVRPSAPDELVDLVRWAGAEGTSLDLRGHGTKRALGCPVGPVVVTDMGAFAGIVEYEPAELMLTAGAATPLAEITTALAAKGQHLAFEPADYGLLLGTEGAGTLGGVVSCNLSGPRRLSAGAARDHVLGLRGVGGTGEAFKAGGKVVKNVTGFDLTKLLCGAFGTLAALTEITVRVVPAPEKVRTVLVLGLEDAAGVRAMTQALNSRHEVSAAAHLPAAQAALCGVDMVAGAGVAVTALRIEGPEPSVAWRCAALRQELAGLGETEELHSSRSRVLWDALRRVAPLAAPTDRLVWRVSVPPSVGAEVVARLRRTLDVAAYYDWGGGLVWLSLSADTPDAGQEAVRGTVAHLLADHRGGGHAMLIRAPDALRAMVPPFQPQADALAALTRRVKQSLDPAGVFGRGRMVGGL